MSKQAATMASSASVKPPSEPKAAVVPGPGLQTQKGKPVIIDAIRLRAYLKWEAAGKPIDDGTKFWLEAERDLLPK